MKNSSRQQDSRLLVKYELKGCPQDTTKSRSGLYAKSEDFSLTMIEIKTSYSNVNYEL